MMTELTSCFPNFEEHPQWHIKAQSSELIDIIGRLKYEFEFIYLLDIYFSGNNEQKTINYLLQNLEKQQRLVVSIEFADQSIPSLEKIWESAIWHEERCSENHKINFDQKHSINLCKDISSDFEFPKLLNLSKEQAEFRHKIVLEPSHPIFCHQFKMAIELEEELIQRSKFEIGFCQKDIEEKFIGNHLSSQWENINDINPRNRENLQICWAKTIEKSYSFDITERAKALRMIFSELNRIEDHLYCLGRYFYLIGVEDLYWSSLRLKKEIRNLLEVYRKENEDHENLILIGGVGGDIPFDWIMNSIDRLKDVLRSVDAWKLRVNNSKIWIERLMTGVCHSNFAIDWGFSGPNARATGVNIDLRKSSPYYFYDQVDFDVPLGTEGHCFDRFYVRLEEIEQSINIIFQLFDNIPAGSVNQPVDFSDIHANTGDSFYYDSIEGPNGELGLSLSLQKDQMVSEAKWRVPSFSHLQGYGQILKGLDVTDAILTYASLNIHHSEVDR